MDILEVITEEVKSIFSEVLETAMSVSLEALESEVLQASRQAGRKVLEACLSQRAEETVSEACPVCQATVRRFQKRQRYVETVCGAVRPFRWMYRCQHGHFHVPWDTVEGVESGYTVGVAKTMCRLAARLDFREAAEELKHQGIRVTHATLQRQVQRFSEGKQAVSESVDIQDLPPGGRWYVSCDGCYTPTQEATYEEVKVGCLYRTDEPSDPGSIPLAVASSLRYVATRGDAASFGSQWFDLATASGLYQDETDTEEVVVIGDGAAWIWNLSQEYFPGALEIVDYMHAKSHLYEAAKLAYGDTQPTPGKVEKWVNATEAFLYAGDIQEVTARIRALGIGTPALSDPLETQTRYFLKHAHRMQYQRFVEKGYHIGSGIIESACKHLVAERCKQASMKWSTPGINAILFWRCLLKNGAWETFWKQHTQRIA